MDVLDQLENLQLEMQAHKQVAKNTAPAQPKNRSLISPVPQLLQSNIPPTEEGIRRIREIILIAQKEEARLRTIFAGSQSTSNRQDAIYRESQKLHEDVQDFIYNHERLLSPLLGFPSELLALIFTLCLPNLETSWRKRRPTWEDQPFRLSQVCQRWRSVALDTPQLWTALGPVDLTAPVLSSRQIVKNGHKKLPFGLKDANASFKFLDAIVRRSKSEGLWLWLYAPVVRYDNKTFQDSVIDLFAKEASRITTLTIQSSPITVKTFCAASDALRSRACSITFPRLQRIVLDIQGHLSETSIDGFMHTPALRDVTVRGMYPFRLSLPWAQLHTYTEVAKVREHSRGNLCDVLTSAKNLQRLEVAHLEYHMSPRSTNIMGSSQFRPSVLIRLTNVCLDFPYYNYHEQSINALLTYFHYPMIQTLRINSCFYNILATFLAIANDRYPQLSGPFTNLTNLYYRSKIPNPSHLISFLHLCPNLEEFDIEMPSRNDLLTFISIYRSSSFAPHHSLAPALKRLFIHWNFSRLGNESADQVLSLLWDATDKLCYNLFRSPFPHIRLIFEESDAFSVNKAQISLNHWITSSSRNIGTLVPFTTWRNDLHEEVPSLNMAAHITWPEYQNFYTPSATRLNTIFVNIEQHKATLQEIRELYISGLHLSLHRLASLPAELVPGDLEHQFRARAMKVLDQWMPVHKADLRIPKTATLWAMMGARSLVFIPLNDPRRTGPDSMKLIYGLDDDLVEEI